MRLVLTPKGTARTRQWHKKTKTTQREDNDSSAVKIIIWDDEIKSKLSEGGMRRWKVLEWKKHLEKQISALFPFSVVVFPFNFIISSGNAFLCFAARSFPLPHHLNSTQRSLSGGMWAQRRVESTLNNKKYEIFIWIISSETHSVALVNGASRYRIFTQYVSGIMPRHFHVKNSTHRLSRVIFIFHHAFSLGRKKVGIKCWKADARSDVLASFVTKRKEKKRRETKKKE